MSTETSAPVRIQTRTWTGRNGVVRHYITNLAEVTGSTAAGQRHISAWINPDGTVGWQGFNNGDWMRAIRESVALAAQDAPAPEQPSSPARLRTIGRHGYDMSNEDDANEYVSRMMETEDWSGN